MKCAKPFLLIGCFVAAAGYLFLGTYEEVKRETSRQFNAQQLLLARQAAKGIENFFQERLADLEFFAARAPIIDFAEQGKEMIESYYHNHREQVTAVLRTDAAGRVLHQEPFSPEMTGRDLSHLEHIQEVMRTRKPVISEVHASTSGFDCVEIHTPVFEESEYRGSLGLSIPFEQLSRDYLADIRVGKEGYAWMLSKKGIELYCPVPGHVGKPVSETCREFDSILAMAEEMMGGREGATTYIFDRVRERDVQSVKKHAVYTPVRLGNTIWSIVVATPEKEYKGPLHLLLTDVIMRDMNGKELFDKIAESFPLARVIYMSGYTDSVIARHGIIEEGVNFVQKPFSIQSLAVKIREVLDRE